jgi:adenine-specific DNA-methyltransferase
MINEFVNYDTKINELPSEYADRLGVLYDINKDSKKKKSEGQYFTPLEIAKLMASFAAIRKESIKILDPGCGTAILACALVEYILKQNYGIKNIELILYEIDLDILYLTNKVLNYLREWISDKGINLQYSVIEKDFILENSGTFFKNSEMKNYDIIISNPPYFKLRKNDERVLNTQTLVSGQTNIYSLFLGLASKLLKEDGELIFITPRSFASGEYFKAFRKYFFSTVKIEKIHLFHSRKDAFSRNKVLQEMIIIKASKPLIKNNYKISISSSNGVTDISDLKSKRFTSNELIDFDSKSKILHLPTSQFEERILTLVSSWKEQLINFHIQISTGKVVSFRASRFIQKTYSEGSASISPLFWLNNIDKMLLKWPLELPNKGQYIQNERESFSLLIPNKTYIFLRRFSTKDDISRLIAAPYFCNFMLSDYIGVENKVNYLYKIDGQLSREETIGLCALLNSEIYDTYFKIINGNINVSATELREMKFPPLNIIIDIGKSIIISNDYSVENINRLINKVLILENNQYKNRYGKIN